MTRALRRTSAAFVALISIYFGLCLYVAARFTSPDKRLPERTPEDVGMDFREVRFRATDGVGLGAWWVPAEGSSRAVLLAHGWNSDSSDEHIVETARLYNGAGYNVLMLDLRGHGGSEATRRTLGYREVRDVRGALRWLEQRGFHAENVVLHGWSMGGAAAIRAAPESGVSAVVSEAGYADLAQVLRRQIPAVSGLPRLFNPGIMLVAKLVLGCDPWAVRPEREAHQLHEDGVPLLIIHSTADAVIPFFHASRFASAHPGAELWKLEDYDHVGAYVHREYRERILEFLERAESEAAWRLVVEDHVEGPGDD